jgi:DNA invertase Pin-like site-specific DNA recombinase
MTDRRQRCIIYVRQSKARAGETEETSLSLTAQETRLRERAEREGWVVVETQRDHDLSGSDPQREGMLRLMERAKEGAADIVLVFAMSRFAREQVWQELAHRQLVAYGLRVVSLNEPNIEHTLFRGVLGVVNQYASEQTSQFVRAAVRQRVEKGLWHGVAPLGYRSEDKVLVMDEETAPVVRRIYALWLGGANLTDIAERLIAESAPPRSGKPWHRTTIRDVIANPAYVGRTHINGTVYEGVHPALIDQADWERAQELLPIRKYRRKTDDRPSWCEGLIVHACGAKMYLADQSHSGSTVWSYTCGTRGLTRDRHCLYRRARIVPWKVEQAVDEVLAADFAALLPTAVVIERAAAAAGGQDAAIARRSIERKRTRIAERKQRAEKLYLDGLRDSAWLVAEEERADAELAELNAEAAALPAEVDPLAIAATAEHLASMRDALPSLPPAEARLILERIGVVVVAEAGISIRYRPEFARFVEEPAVYCPPRGPAHGPDRRTSTPYTKRGRHGDTQHITPVRRKTSEGERVT